MEKLQFLTILKLSEISLYGPSGKLAIMFSTSLISTVPAEPQILVVDDMPANLVAMKRLLKGIPAKLVTANSGNEALALAVSNDYAMILLDVNMPEMDGFEVAEHLSEATETNNIPIIFVTAVHHDKDSMLRGYDAGAVDYVDKPITPSILIAKVQVFLNMWILKAGLENEISMRREAELEIEYLAQHDALTKLPNRRQIHKLLLIMIEQSKRKKEKFALLFIDLDGFKNVNDDLGHEAGDLVLRVIAQRLQDCLRAADVVGRHGGDEFVILLSDISNPLGFTNKLEMLVNEVGKPILWESTDDISNEAHVGASIGVAVYPEHGETLDALLSSADEAMYQSKHDGKNTFRYYSEELNAAMKRRIQIDHHLHYAINKNEFELHFQPVINVQSGKLVGAEALLRWNNHQLGVISPEEFIPIAEQHSYINDIGLWVFNQVLPVMQAYPKLRIAINASGLQFHNHRLNTAIEDAIQEQRLNPEQFEIEITEGVLLSESREVDGRIQGIRDQGISLSLDDFGTGYSSLSCLKRCPVNALKIDRSFVMDIPDNKENQTLVAAIIAMAKGLSLTVIAEGVETKEQWEFLKRHQCDFAQGYYFSKPLPIKEFNEYLDKA